MSKLAGPALDVAPFGGRLTSSVDPEPTPAPPRVDLERVARITIPLHLALPFLLWGLALLHPSAAMGLFLGVHALFPVLLVATYGYWRGQGLDVVLLVVLNHLATFLSGGLAAAIASAL